MRTWALAVTLVGAAGAARCGAPAPLARFTLHVPPGTELSAESFAIQPLHALRSLAVVDGEVALALDARVGPATLSAPGLCPVTLDPAHEGPVTAARWIDPGPDLGQVGYDAPFEVDLVGGCAEAASGRVTWTQVEGPPLRDWQVDGSGFHLRARTRTLAELAPSVPPWGIVRTSPATQGRYVLEATWRGAGRTEVTRLTVTSAARSTGVPSLAVAQRVWLAGDGWRVRIAPPGGHATVRPEPALASFAADAPGRWVLEDAQGAQLALRAGSFDHTPLGCGTPDCHRAESEAVASGAMTHALERHMAREGEPAVDVSCMLDCHVAGERGIHDGGFVDRAALRDWNPRSAATWSDLPRALRRLGGVGCTSCHGPGAIPERTASRAVLRVEVCATCHDAPPRYSNVRRWEGSRMARSDALPETRARLACSRCHMTAGFLAVNGLHGMRFADVDDLHAEPAGVGCAACHASHAAHERRALVRKVPLPAAFEGGEAARSAAASSTCIPCHAPVPGDGLPSASAAALWAGRIEGLPATSSDVPAPHRGIGCADCHGATPSGFDHSFEVDPGLCAARCHGRSARPLAAAEDGKALAARALAAWRSLSSAAGWQAAPDPGALHRGAVGLPPGLPPSLARALYETAVVLADPAAHVHNGPLARRLLDDAEAAGAGAR